METMSQLEEGIAAEAQGFACIMRRLFFHGWRRFLLLSFRMPGYRFYSRSRRHYLCGLQATPHCWFVPADSAALTPEPRPMENDLRHSHQWGRGDVSWQNLLPLESTSSFLGMIGEAYQLPATQPPSTNKVCPVTKSDAALER
jgi:hypothetical protein